MLNLIASSISTFMDRFRTPLRQPRSATSPAVGAHMSYAGTCITVAGRRWDDGPTNAAPPMPSLAGNA